MSDEIDIFRLARPLYLISKCLGLAPFTCVSCDNSKRFQFSYFGTLYTGVMVILIGVCFITSIAARMTWVYPTVKTTTTVADVLILCSLVVTAIINLIFSAITNRRGIDTILKKITYIDTLLFPNPQLVYLKTKLFLYFQIVCIFSVLGILYCYDCWVWVESFGYRNMYYAVSYLVFTVNYVMNMQFVNLILLLRHRFNVVNTKLIFPDGTIFPIISCKENHINPTYTTPEIEDISRPHSNNELHYRNAAFNNHVVILVSEEAVTPPVIFSTMRQAFFKLRILHDMLCDVAALVNDTYGFQILLDIATTLINITTYLYFCLLYTLHLHSYDSEIIHFGRMLSLHLFWLAMYLFKIVCIAMSCHGASVASSKTGVLTQKLLLLHDLDAESIYELEAFCRQLQPRQLCFTACGLFSLNLSVLCSIAGAVTTYLVILLQFQISY